MIINNHISQIFEMQLIIKNRIKKFASATVFSKLCTNVCDS